MKYFTIALLIFFSINVVAEIDWKKDPIEGISGVHLISDYGSTHVHLSSDISIENVISEIDKLDWKNNFYQLVVVTEPGISMEVGGSLNPSDGLSAVYRNRLIPEEAVTINAPENVQEMKDILVLYLSNNYLWKFKFGF